MRAFALRNFGEAPTLCELPIPSADREFLIRVKYAGINPLDNILVERLTATSKYPFVLGIDFAGVVERAPEGELSLRTGTITARIHSAIQPPHIAEVREELRAGGLHGKVVIRF
jgi:NADPH2:quinone reductase